MISAVRWFWTKRARCGSGASVRDERRPGGARERRRWAAGLVVGALVSCGAPQAPVVEPVTTTEPAAAPAVEPVLTPEAQATLDAAYREWQTRLAAEWAALLQLEQAGRLPPAITAMVSRAHGQRQAAVELQRAGKRAAAADAMHAAWAAASAANLAAATVRLAASGEIDAAIAGLGTFDAARARAVFGERQPAARIDVLAALQAGLHAWAQSALAGDALGEATARLEGLRGKPAADRNAPAVADAVSDAVVRALQAMRAADAALAELGRVLGEPVPAA